MTEDLEFADDKKFAFVVGTLIVTAILTIGIFIASMVAND